MASKPTSRLAGLLKPAGTEEKAPATPRVSQQAEQVESAPQRAAVATPLPEPAPPPVAPVEAAPPTAQVMPETPYLLRPTAQEATIQAGLRLRASLKHRLAQYVLDLKQMGYPASEAKVVEVMIMLLDDPETRQQLTRTLTGRDGKTLK